MRVNFSSPLTNATDSESKKKVQCHMFRFLSCHSLSELDETHKLFLVLKNDSSYLFVENLFCFVAFFFIRTV